MKVVKPAKTHVVVQDNRPMQPGQVRLGMPGDLFCFAVTDPRYGQPGYVVIASGTLGGYTASTDALQTRRVRLFVADGGDEYEVFRDGSTRKR